ncbi:MAG TPA: NADH dehydrogenase (quinone) subunit D [Vicinamibacterales bacterium]|jgi:NADH-quinone oxidoreductase subunit D|nr:NADH dehydrogenase (quinone) subunit D [Vicinamibacterales bacterium]
MSDIRTETMTVNMGPQHPSTHGVLRLVLELDGEVIQSVIPTIGYLHTGIEKTAEQKKWQQVIPLVERMDYLAAQSNSLAYALSVEKLLGLEMPQRVKDIRVLIAELQRIASHLIWIGTHGLEIGAVSMLFYAVRERELLLNINELIAGFRFFPSYIRIGGLREDLPRGFHAQVQEFLDRFPAKIDEFEGLLTKNDMYRRRTEGVGFITKEHAYAWGLVGPIARAGGSDYDVRKYFPYSGYETYDFKVPIATEGDVYARYRVRVAEMRESLKIAKQALDRISPTGVFACNDTRVVPPPKDKVYSEMEALIQHFLIYSQGFTVPAGEAYVPVEGPRGEHGCYIVSDGTNRPWRVKMRAPSFMAIQALPTVVQGGLIADVVAVIGSTDVVMGDCDR